MSFWISECPVQTLGLCEFKLFSKNYTFKKDFFKLFSARQHICYSALYVIARPSVCLSHGWIGRKRLKLGSRNLHHRVAHDSSFLTLNFTAKFQREHRERGRRIREGYEKYAISQKRCKIGPTWLLMTNRKWHMRFRSVPKSLTLDDLERTTCSLLQQRCVF